MGNIEVLTPHYRVVYMELFTPSTYNRIYANAVETYPNHYIQITFKSKL